MAIKKTFKKRKTFKKKKIMSKFYSSKKLPEVKRLTRLVNRTSVPIPSEYYCKMKSNIFFDMTANEPIGAISLASNSLHSNINQTFYSPAGYYALSQLYMRYVVMAYRITCEVVNNQTGKNLRFYMFPSDIAYNALVANTQFWPEEAEQKGSIGGLIPFSTSTPYRRYKQYVNIAALVGNTLQKADAYWGWSENPGITNPNTNPLNTTYHNFIIDDSDAVTHPQCTLNITFEYYVKWFQPNALSGKSQKSGLFGDEDVHSFTVGTTGATGINDQGNSF